MSAYRIVRTVKEYIWIQEASSIEDAKQKAGDQGDPYKVELISEVIQELPEEKS